MARRLTRRYCAKLYNRLPAGERARIEARAREHCQETAEAVLEYIGSSRPIQQICMRHNISDSTLYRAAERFYRQI